MLAFLTEAPMSLASLGASDVEREAVNGAKKARHRRHLFPTTALLGIPATRTQYLALAFPLARGRVGSHARGRPDLNLFL